MGDMGDDYYTSLSSSQSSTLTLTLHSMSLRRGRGRPRKELVEPSLNGYPADGTEEEKKRWLCMKCTEQGDTTFSQVTKLMSTNGGKMPSVEQPTMPEREIRAEGSCQYQVQHWEPLSQVIPCKTRKRSLKNRADFGK